MDNIQLNCAKVELIDNNLVRVTYADNYNIELEDVKELEKVLLELIKEGLIYSIIDTNGRFHHASKEALKYLATEAPINSQIGGSGVIINNLPVRILVRFFISAFKPKYPIKIFKKENEVIAWLYELKKEQELVKS